MARFGPSGSVKSFQALNHAIYGKVDDRFYSTVDLALQVQRFAMRALKGIRKGDKKRIMLNLSITYSWLNALASRLSIDLERVTWDRFPMMCSYCGERPCVCRATNPVKRKELRANAKLHPKSLAGFQDMFRQIYPPQSRTLEHAGVHFAEEVGEVAEAIHIFLGEHKPGQFRAIRHELADCVSCIFGVANSMESGLADELAQLFKNGCHSCHKTPCICTFNFAAAIKT